MEILDHDTEGATVHLNQEELLLVYSMIQEGREAFRFRSADGEALESIFQQAAIMVGIARRAINERPGSGLKPPPGRPRG